MWEDAFTSVLHSYGHAYSMEAMVAVIDLQLPVGPSHFGFVVSITLLSSAQCNHKPPRLSSILAVCPDALSYFQGGRELQSLGTTQCLKER